MRVLKSILVAAGNLKKANPKENELKLCLRALFQVNLPKFTQNDIPLFQSITSDLFPGVQKFETDYSTLTNQLKEECKKLHIQATDTFITKCSQLYETLLVRHGLMLVASTMSGKSCVIETLKNALSSLDGTAEFISTRTFNLNPKAVT